LAVELRRDLATVDEELVVVVVARDARLNSPRNLLPGSVIPPEAKWAIPTVRGAAEAKSRRKTAPPLQ